MKNLSDYIKEDCCGKKCHGKDCQDKNCSKNKINDRTKKQYKAGIKPGLE